MRVVQISCLGNFGRLGNQFFQYSFAKSYAQKYDAILEIPSNWIGRKLFKNINEPPIYKPLPKTSLDVVPWGEVNIDLFGYFQFKECYSLYSRQETKNWFQFYTKWLDLFPKEGHYIACHLRRGDYEKVYSQVYCIISKNSYIEACNEFDLDLNKVIWVSEENKKTDTHCEMEGVGFLPDFMTLYHADILLRANSCFSLWAGILNGNEVYSPVVVGKIGFQDVKFVKGNEELILDNYSGSSPQSPSKFIFKGNI